MMVIRDKRIDANLAKFPNTQIKISLKNALYLTIILFI